VDPDAPQPETSEVDSLPNVKSTYDPGRDREKSRGRLAAWLVVILGGTVAVSYAWLALGWGTSDEVNALLDRFLAPLVGLTGTALGFYFGGTTKDT
jgi:hypothetical protein